MRCKSGPKPTNGEATEEGSDLASEGGEHENGEERVEGHVGVGDHVGELQDVHVIGEVPDVVRDEHVEHVEERGAHDERERERDRDAHERGARLVATPPTAVNARLGAPEPHAPTAAALNALLRRPEATCAEQLPLVQYEPANDPPVGQYH